VVIYPTIVNKKANIHVSANETTTWKLIEATGNEYTHGTASPGDNLIAAPNTTGYYLMQVTTSDGSQYIERIIIY